MQKTLHSDQAALPGLLTQRGGSLKPVAVLVGISALWACSWLAFKVGLRDIPAFTLAYMRFAIAIPVLAVIAWRAGLSLPRDRRTWQWLIAAGFTGFALNYLLVFWGSQFIPAGLSAVLQSTIPACTLLMSRIWLPYERVSRWGVASILSGIVGVIVIFSDQLRISSTSALWGCVALALTALTNAGGGIIVKRTLTGLNPILLALLQQSIGVLVLLTVGLISDGPPWSQHWTPTALAAVVYMALGGSVTAFLGFYWLLQRWPASKAMLYSIIMPVLTLSLGWLFLGEQVTGLTLVGSTVVIASVALALRR